MHAGYAETASHSLQLTKISERLPARQNMNINLNLNMNMNMTWLFYGLFLVIFNLFLKVFKVVMNCCQ